MKFPMMIELLDNGKTLILLYPGPAQDQCAEALLEKLGEPEEGGPLEDAQDPGTLALLYPHQDLPAELREVAERMTTQNRLRALGFKLEESLI